MVVRAVPGERKRLEDIGSVELTVATDGSGAAGAGRAGVEPVVEEPILWRRNREMVTLTVRADIGDGVQAPAWRSCDPVGARADQRRRCRPVTASRPAAPIEESVKGNARSSPMFPIMLVVTLTLLMIQLQSFARRGDRAPDRAARDHRRRRWR